MGSAEPDWEQLPPDPDPIEDLGYDLLDLEVIRAESGSKQYMILPQDEDMIRDNTYLVATESAICHLCDYI